MDRREFLALAASAPFVLAGAASAMREALGGGTPAVLVTADTEAHVAVVSVRSGRVLRRVPTLEGPRSIEAAAGRLAVVAHTGEGAVSLLDAGTLRVRRVLRGFAEPRYTAADPFGRYAYVTDSGHGEVAAIDLERGRVVRRTAVGGPARHVSLDPASGRLWTALGSQAPRLALLDVRDPAGPRLAGRLLQRHGRVRARRDAVARARDARAALARRRGRARTPDRTLLARRLLRDDGVKPRVAG
jgi:hypothetical protein